MSYKMTPAGVSILKQNIEKIETLMEYIRSTRGVILNLREIKSEDDLNKCKIELNSFLKELERRIEEIL